MNLSVALDAAKVQRVALPLLLNVGRRRTVVDRPLLVCLVALAAGRTIKRVVSALGLERHHHLGQYDRPGISFMLFHLLDLLDIL